MSQKSRSISIELDSPTSPNSTKASQQFQVTSSPTMNMFNTKKEEEKVLNLKFLSRSEIHLVEVQRMKQMPRKMSNPIDRLRPTVITNNSVSRLQTARARFDSDLCKYKNKTHLSVVTVAPMERPDLSNLIDESI